MSPCGQVYCISMLPLYKTRRKTKRLVFYSIILLGFLTLWCTLTVIILYLQNSLLLAPVEFTYNHRENGLSERAVHVVVGHYNGNLAQEKLKNLTEEEVNANNYSPLEGWGENGAPVELTNEQQKEADDQFPINQFNIYVSDRIYLNRTLPDVRKPSCRTVVYPETTLLPPTSVIIVYHNEAYSTLLRTVWSVINRSPHNLIHEIILVDDFSNRTFLAASSLDKAIRDMPVTVKILRAKERVGLIRARLMGAQEATGDVLTFLDSHCECTKGWLEPLLARIRENRKNVVCPVIDVINDKTFQYQKGIELFRGGFNWNLQFRWYSLPTKMAKQRTKDPTSPIASPTMAGGLFSIDRLYFEELGEYDPGMDIWGGENLEISFRIWQCGGRVEILPCSHVGHIFRKHSPHDIPGKTGKVLNENLIRAAEVWMDEWKHMFYKLAPQAANMRSSIDVSDRVELRKRLRCKDFRWYLDNVYTDHFYPIEGDIFGRISNFPQSNSSSHCICWIISSSTGFKQPSYAKCRDDKNDTAAVRNQIDAMGYCIVSRPGEAGKNHHKLMLQQCTMGFDYWQVLKGKTENELEGLDGATETVLRPKLYQSTFIVTMGKPLILLFVWTLDGRIRSDEHLCLSATPAIHSSTQWNTQLKECGGMKHEYWTFRNGQFKHAKSGLCLGTPALLSSNSEVNAPVMESCGSQRDIWTIRPVTWKS